MKYEEPIPKRILSAKNFGGFCDRSFLKSFKLFVYLAALEAGMRPEDTVVDGPVSIKDWRPQNYTGRYLGNITLRDAFAKSVNTAAVKISEKIGRQKVIFSLFSK